jgi:predicted ATP-dependent serine protease
MTPREIASQNINYAIVPGFEFLGALSDQVSFFLYGPPGGGKSTFALRFANVLARKEKTLYIAAEENLNSATLVKKIREQHIDSEHMVVIEVERIKDLFREIRRESPKHLVVDSISFLGFSCKTVKRVKEMIPGFSLFIAQITKQKSYRGGGDILHLVDIELVFSDGEAVTGKNRYGLPDSCYRVFTPVKGQKNEIGNNGHNGRSRLSGISSTKAQRIHH